MNVSRENKDSLNALVTINIEKNDYAKKVDKILTDYRKTANIPGFRKGQVPMGLVKKKYNKAVTAEEINKILQESLSNYLKDEKLDVLGNPMPVFSFEIGLSPKFEIKLKGRKAITHYNITADDKLISNQIINIQKQYGKLISKDKAEENDEITGQFFNDSEGIDSTATFSLDKLKGKSNLKNFIGAKSGDIISLKTKGLFSEKNDLVTYLKLDNEVSDNLNIEVVFTIKEINSREPADLDKELFDKLFGKDVIKTVTEFKEKLKSDAEKQFIQQSDQKLLNDVTAYLVDNTKFKLPSKFLTKWLKTVGEEPLTDQQAIEEYEKSEKSMRYQLIESKLIVDNNLQVNFEELKSFAAEMIKTQMAQFGQLNPSDKEVDDIVARVLSNKDEVKRMSEQLTSQKLLTFYKENVKLKVKKLNYDAFVKEVYGK
jgi:trigger factor